MALRIIHRASSGFKLAESLQTQRQPALGKGLESVVLPQAEQEPIGCWPSQSAWHSKLESRVKF